MLFFEQYQIYKILHYYCENNKYADEEFVYKILDIIIKSRSYKHYVKSIEINPKTNDETQMGSYDFVRKKILIKTPIQDFKVVNYNLEVLHYILHECEHVKQFKQCNDKTKSLQKTLLKEDLADDIFFEKIDLIDKSKLSLHDIWAIRSKEMYYTARARNRDEMWEYLPSERMAEMDSYKYIINILKKEKDIKLRKAKEKYEKIYIISNLLGYEQKDNRIICPTYTMYQKYDELAPYKKLTSQIMPILDSYSQNANLEERLYLGLPITQTEYNSKLEKITKKKIKN